MDIETTQTTKWKEYEGKLKVVASYINRRIEELEHNKIEKPRLSEVLNGILYCIEDSNLETVYKQEIKDEIKVLADRDEEDVKKIIKALKTYWHRIKKDIFTDFFLEGDIGGGFYRIDLESEIEGTTIYVGHAKNKLEALFNLREDIGEFHLKNPKEDIIDVHLCKEFRIDGKNNQNYRCNKLIGPCVLAHYGDRKECPELEKLIKKETDFFEEVISKIEKSLKPFSTS